MEYIGKTDWKSQDIVMPVDMNRIEQGIVDADTELSNVPINAFTEVAGNLYTGNLDSVKAGVTSCADTATNLPLAEAGKCICINSGNYDTQLYIPRSGNYIYSRNNNGSVWTNWIRLANIADIAAISSQILDVNGNEILKFSPAANAVNKITIYNNSTGYQPVLGVTGSDANIGLALRSKGIGTIIGFIGNAIGYSVKAIANTASAVNYLTFGAGATTVSPTIESTGADANIDIKLSPKGTGGVIETRVNFTEATTLANIVSGESNTTLWGKVKKMFSFIGTTTLTTTAQTITTAINELNTNLSRNFLNGSKNFKQVKMEYNQSLATFTNGVTIIPLSQSYTDGVAVVNIVGAGLSESIVEGDVLTITAAKDGALYTGITPLYYQIMGY